VSSDRFVRQGNTDSSTHTPKGTGCGIVQQADLLSFSTGNVLNNIVELQTFPLPSQSQRFQPPQNNKSTSTLFLHDVTHVPSHIDDYIDHQNH
jgi:hypothetical protein